MTCIAWDGTTLAVDSLCVFDNRRTYTDKLFKNKTTQVDEVIAVSGDLDVCMNMLARYRAGSFELADYIPHSEDNQSFLVIASRDSVYWMGDGCYPVKVNDKFFALGSGADFAIGAMHCGKSAVEAVEIACLYDINCGGKVLFHSFIGAVEKKKK